MTQQRYSTQRDLTAALRVAQPSVPLLMAYLCGHKAKRFGGEWRGGLPMRCPMCVHGRKDKQ